MLSKLAKIATRLDSLGLTREADTLDSFMRKIAEDSEPFVPKGQEYVSKTAAGVGLKKDLFIFAAAASEPGHLNPQSTFLKFKRLIDDALMNKSFGMPGDTTDGYIKDFNNLLRYWEHGSQDVGDDKKYDEKKDGSGMSGTPDLQSPLETYNAWIARLGPYTGSGLVQDDIFAWEPRYLETLVCVPYEGRWCLLPNPEWTNKFPPGEIAYHYHCDQGRRLRDQRMRELCKTIIPADEPPPSGGRMISCNFTKGRLS